MKADGQKAVSMMNSREKLVPNNNFLRGYALTLGLGAMQLPFAMTGASSLTDIY